MYDIIYFAISTIRTNAQECFHLALMVLKLVSLMHTPLHSEYLADLL